jgi:hypothetical protein
MVLLVRAAKGTSVRAPLHQGTFVRCWRRRSQRGPPSAVQAYLGDARLRAHGLHCVLQGLLIAAQPKARHGSGGGIACVRG